MIEMQIKFLSPLAAAINEDGKALNYATSGSSGLDLRALTILEFGTSEKKWLISEKFPHLMPENCEKIASYELAPQQRVMIGCGLAMAIADGYEVQIRSRSGLAWKNGIVTLNSPGTVDADYRGEMCAILFNTSDRPLVINCGDRIAQMVIMEVVRVNLEIKTELPQTERGSGGFGSTGIR